LPKKKGVCQPVYRHSSGEKISALDTAGYLQARAQRADGGAFAPVLVKVADRPPVLGDELL